MRRDICIFVPTTGHRFSDFQYCSMLSEGGYSAAAQVPDNLNPFHGLRDQTAERLKLHGDTTLSRFYADPTLPSNPICWMYAPVELLRSGKTRARLVRYKHVQPNHFSPHRTLSIQSQALGHDDHNSS
jgi:hypothetical protein